MTAAVLRLSDHRAVFVLPDCAGTVVLLASRGPVPRISLERKIADPDEAAEYARGLSKKYECSIIGPVADASGEDVA
jgi:hypothetical protein